MAKTKRDPAKPKRYMSAFLLFLGEFRKKNGQRGYNNTLMIQKGAAVWRRLSPTDKQPYEDWSQKLKLKYTEACQKYKDTRKSCPTKKKDPNRPKKPLSAYMLFMKDFRVKNSGRGWDVTDMVSRGARLWKTLSDEDMVPYQNMARKSSETFHKKLAIYKQEQKKMKQIATKIAKKDTKIKDTKTRTPGKGLKPKSQQPSTKLKVEGSSAGRKRINNKLQR